MTRINIAVARPDQRGVLENLMQLYVHDFSEFWAGLDRGYLSSDGRFDPYPLDAYWQEAGRVPLLLRADDHLAGFALLNTHTHSGDPCDRNMAEFFVARKYRRSGFGTLAAQQIFAAYPGQWELAVARRNLAALAFWRHAAATAPGVKDLRETDLSTSDWEGPILRFQIKA